MQEERCRRATVYRSNNYVNLLQASAPKEAFRDAVRYGDKPEFNSPTSLVPVQLAGYVLVLYAVADRASVRTRSRVAAAQPLLYQRFHLFVGELVPQLYRRVARYGGEDPLLSAHPLCRTPHSGDCLPETSCHVTTLCQGRDHPVYPEGVLAERFDLKAVDRKLLKGSGCSCATC
jgi:hypothetical protein